MTNFILIIIQMNQYITNGNWAVYMVYQPLNDLPLWSDDNFVAEYNEINHNDYRFS